MLLTRGQVIVPLLMLTGGLHWKGRGRKLRVIKTVDPSTNARHPSSPRLRLTVYSRSALVSKNLDEISMLNLSVSYYVVFN